MTKRQSFSFISWVEDCKAEGELCVYASHLEPQRHEVQDQAQDEAPLASGGSSVRRIALCEVKILKY